MFTLTRNTLSILSLIAITCSTTVSTTALAEAPRKAGQWYIAWGWNNADYTDSDIHFQGADHDFTLHDVEANDRQSEIGGGGWYENFLNPSRITIAQTNAQIGYFITDNLSISFNIDHMKYVMESNQVVTIDSNVANTTIDNATNANNKITLSPDLLKYEHTDGLNYISIGGQYFRSFWQPIAGIDFSWVVGGGAGLMYPKTNVTLLDRDKNDNFYWSGYGYDIKAGIEISFSENFFFRYMIKQGHINMPDIVTSSEDDEASQKFDFTEYLGIFGYRF